MAPPTPKHYDAFLSYNSRDRAAVTELADRLKKNGLEVYLESWELAAGQEFQQSLAQGLLESKTCVVFLGPNGLGPWQKQELQVAIDRRLSDKAFHVIPVLLPGVERPRRGDVAHLEFLLNASWVEFLRTLDDDRAFRSLVWGITGKKPTEPESIPYAGVCPYRGLEAFGPDDAKFFFGREALTEWLISDLRREIRSDQGARFLGVLGPSGSGKSSVVMAGLIAKLKAGAIESSERWPIAILRPGVDPLENLAVQVSTGLPTEKGMPDVSQVRQLIDELQQDERALDRFTRLSMHDMAVDSRLVIVVDQFEEVFTHRPLGDQARSRFDQARAWFFANLLYAAAAPSGRVVVVLTMRSDFLGACATYPQLSSVLSAHQELVGPMTNVELRAAIEQPSFLVGCEVEPALTERLLADVEGRPGALPLLQFALTEVWKQRDTRRLTLRSYERLGGVEGALEHRANEIFGALQPEDQELCRRIFLRLVEIGEGIENTRRRASYNELLPVDPSKSDAISRLINRLSDRDACLITVNATNANDVTVEVVHEALIRSWTKLRQ